MRKENSMYDVLNNVIRRDEECIDKLEWCDSGSDRYLELDQFGIIPVDDYHFVLKTATDEESAILLDDFICKRTPIGYGLACQLSRLLSEKGLLVAGKMERIFRRVEWKPYASRELLLSYLAVKPDGAEWAKKMLDIVPPDSRDGLFLACWKIKDKRLQAKLLRKFEEWLAKDETWGVGTGEDGWLGRFIAKWLGDGTFTYERLEKCIRWHFKHMPL